GTRGAIDTFALLTATAVNGTPSSVRYDTVAVVLGASTYVGATNGGLDGLFVDVDLTPTTVSLTNYLALPGDANGDHVVDGSDFGIWNANKFRPGTNWSTGDFNGDGVTDGSDFGIWNANKFTSVAISAAVNNLVVPEPTMALGLALAIAACLTRRGLSWYSA
ncbi:MAG TPA: PEP-CTERM sorting domain-containing protein, partial [Pirellulaceae bacterium]